MSRTFCIVSMALSCALAACGESASPQTTGGGSSSATAGGTAGSGSIATSSATASTGAGSSATSGTGGSTGGSTMATGGGGSTGTSGSGGASGGAPDMDAAGGDDGARDASRTDAPTGSDARFDAVGADSGSSSCPPSAVICDDFEKYADGATNLAPDWITYTYSGAVRVDATKPRGGRQSLHVTTQQGMRRYADIMRETRGQELVPRKHYGRLMLWLTTIPQGGQHWNINISSGPMVGFPNEMAKFAEGGMFGKLMSNYAQRARAMANGMYLLRGGGPENGDPGPEADCAVAAPTQTIAPRKWVCWEWLYDGTADSAYLWLDGQAMTEIDAITKGTQCQGPGFNGKPMMTGYRWESPQFFDKVIIGYEQYQDMPAQEAWIDDVVVGPERIGCPMP